MPYTCNSSAQPPSPNIDMRIEQLPLNTVAAISVSASLRCIGTFFMLSAVLMSIACKSAVADEQADASIQTLETFIQNLDSFEASFEQTLYGADSEPLQTSEGTIKLKRPARFVWAYTSPEPQLILADGERIWLYDEDLEQVTVNAIDERINGTPLQLLMQAAPLSEGFDIESLGVSEGIDWFGLTPLSQSSDFEQVFIGLQGDTIAAMELRDSFGQATQIRLDNFKTDVQFDDSLFVFDIPEGVDVIGLDE